jgi:predicted nuclease of predicted toxin-antitoxin system
MIRIKLDENLGSCGKEIFIKHDFIVDTVHDEGLCSASDHILISKCKIEERILISLDLDFANPLVFKPSKYHGIIVIRLSKKSSPQELYDNIDVLANTLKDHSVSGKLWIIYKKVIREYQEDKE